MKVTSRGQWVASIVCSMLTTFDRPDPIYEGRGFGIIAGIAWIAVGVLTTLPHRQRPRRKGMKFKAIRRSSDRHGT